MNEEAIIEKLDELIAATKAATIPLTERWLDAAGVGALLGQEPRYVLERIACRPDFPRPLRINGGHPRWKACEVSEWADDTRNRLHKPGRKRLPG